MGMTRMLCLIAAFGMCAAAQDAPPVIYRPGGDVVAPRVIDRLEPIYSEEARIAKAQGSVLLSLIVGADGQPRDLRVRKPLGLGLDENAVTAVSHWRFEPGTKAGQPVDVEITVEVSYRVLSDANSWHLSRAVFHPQDGATLPVVVRAPYPPEGRERSGAASVVFDVNEQGLPIHIRVENSSAPELEDEVTALIREWRFQAAMRNGIPVLAHGYLDFVYGLDALEAAAPEFRKR